MKNLSLFILFIIFLCDVSAQDIKLFEPKNYIDAVKKGTRSRDGNPGKNYWQNHADYDISVRLDTASKKIFGEETIIYFNESPDTLKHIVLRLYPNLYKKGAIRNETVNSEDTNDGVNLDTLIIDDKGLIVNDTATWTNGTNLRIRLDTPLPPNQTLKLFCRWDFKLPLHQSFRRTGYYKDNAWFIGYFYPQIAVYDDLEKFYFDNGWDFMLFHQGQQEFYNDFNNFNVKIEVPKDFYVWATGDLIDPEKIYPNHVLEKFKEAKSSDNIIHIMKQGDNHSPLNNIWHFEANNVTDFGFGTARDYIWDATSVAIGEKRVFVDVAYHPESKLYNMVIDIARETVEYASEIYPGIEFPYNHTTTFNGMNGGGMEFPMIANNAYMEDTTFLQLLTFHEIFHNYFPFMMGFNEKRYFFMDESLTEYFTDYYLIHKKEMVPNKYMDVYEMYNFQAPIVDNTIINSSAGMNNFNMFFLNYVKPKIALRLFAEMVGEDNFIFALKEFVKRWKGKHPIPYDLFYTFNDALKENYNWFWKSWYFNFGYPDLGLKIDGNKLIVERVGEGSLPLPVHLKIDNVDGSFDSIKKPMNVWKNGDKEIFIKLKNKKKIKSVRIDVSNIPDIDHNNNVVNLN